MKHNTPVIGADGNCHRNVDVEHFYGKYGVHGRQYSKLGFMALSEDSRARMASPNYVHIKILNSFPIMLYNLVSKHLSKNMLNDFNRILTGSNFAVAKDLGLDAKMLEDALNTATRLGQYTYKTGGIIVPFLTEYRALVDTAWLLLISRYPDEYALAEQSVKDSKKSANGRFADIMLHKTESACMRALKEYCQSQSLEIGEDGWDSLLIRKSPVIDAVFLANATDYIKEKTDFGINLGPMPMVYKEREVFAPGKIVLFDNAVLDGRDLGSLQKLVNKGILVGIYTDLPRTLIRNCDGASKFNIILSSEDCYEPDEKFWAVTGMKKYEKCKSLQLHFPDHCKNNTIRMVDVNSSRFPSYERHRVLVDVDFEKMIDRLLVDFNYISRPFDDDAYLVVYEEKDMRVNEKNPSLRSINEIIFETGVRCIAIAAHMGSGKSHAAVELVKADRLAHPGVKRRVLVLGCRIQQDHTAMALFKDYGAKLYSDIEGSLSDVDFLVCQVESVCRLQFCRKWDLIIVDEVKSVLNQFTSAKTNKSNLKINNDFLRIFMAGAGKVLLMDAHLEFDGMVKDFMTATFKPSEMQVRRYDYNPMKRKLIRYTDEADILGVMVKVIMAKKRIMCVFRSKKHMYKTIALMQEYPSQIVSFSGDTGGEKMRAFQDIDHYIVNSGTTAICFTSKVTVGSDIQTPIDMIFCFCDTAGGSTARDVFQGMGRARNLTSGEIHMWTGKKDRYLEHVQTPKQGEQEILENKALRQDYFNILSGSMLSYVHEDECYKWTPGEVCKQFAFTLSEKNTGFNINFDRLARFSGLVETASDMETEAIDTNLQYRIAYEHQQSQIALITSILTRQQGPFATTFKQFEELLQQRKQQQTTDENNVLLDYLIPYFKYDESFRPQLEWTHILATMESAPDLDAAKMLANMTLEEWKHSDAIALRFAAFPEFIKCRGKSFPYLIEACILAGFSGLTDGAVTDNIKIARNRPKILELTSLSAKADRGRVQGEKCVVKAMKRELNRFGFDIVVGRARVNGSRIHQYTLKNDAVLKKITVLRPPKGEKEEREEEEEDEKTGEIKVLVSELLPYYRNKTPEDMVELLIDDEWDQECLLEALVASSKATASAAKASASAAKAALSAARACAIIAEFTAKSRKRRRE